jgi:hypothetical protein
MSRPQNGSAPEFPLRTLKLYVNGSGKFRHHSFFRITFWSRLHRMATLKTTRSGGTAVLKVFCIGLIFVAMVSVPYHFPAPLSISRSYVAGFSNRAAIVLLFLGTGLFAIFTRGQFARTEDKDSTLGLKSLAVGIIVTILRCVRHSLRDPPGGEAFYFLNRVQLLSAGLKPYRQFEFVYGPLLLYPVLWVQRLLHRSIVFSYGLVWLTFWIIGIFFIWFVVKNIDFPIASRVTLFAFLLALQLAFSHYGGLSYTPGRGYCAAFCLTVLYVIFNRYRNPWLSAAVTIALVGLAMGCSMDQAVGVTLGAFAFLLLLVLTPATGFSWPPFVLALLGTTLCWLWADHADLTAPLRSFGGGGYSYPLLPSVGIFLVIAAYIISGCCLLRALYIVFSSRKDAASSSQTSIVIPLVIAGCSMIPNALGRCDLLHITAAIPAFVIGVAAICAAPGVRRWWFTLATLTLVMSQSGFWQLVAPKNARQYRHIDFAGVF